MLITNSRITTRYFVLLYYKRKGKYGVVIKSEIESIILKPPLMLMHDQDGKSALVYPKSA